MNRILLLTDFEPYTYQAMHYALQLALKMRATLNIIDTASDAFLSNQLNISYFEFISQYSIGLSDTVSDYFESVQSFFSNDDLKKITVDYHTEVKFKTEQIELLVRRKEIDFIILSSKEKLGIRNIFFRNELDTLIAHAACPILVVPKQAHFNKEIAQLVFATNLMKEGKKAIQWGHDLAQFLEIDYTFLHITDERSPQYKHQKTDFQLLVNELLGSDEFNFTEIQDDNVLAVLKEFTQKNPHSILAMYKKDKSTFDKLLHIDFVEKMAFAAHSPILIFRENMNALRRNLQM